MSRPVPLADVIRLLGDGVREVVGPTEPSVRTAAPITERDACGAVSFYSRSPLDAALIFAQSGAVAILCTADAARVAERQGLTGKTLIVVDDPRLAFCRVLDAFFAPAQERRIHPTASVDPAAVVGDNVAIGPYAQVGSCTVGAGTVLHGRVCLYDGVTLGRDVVVHAGSVIGADGFGYARDRDGTLVKFLQLGRVVVGDRVEIGANACIDRGALAATEIGAGSKIDDLAYIAHNVVIGRDVLVMAGCIIAGGAEIGDGAELAPGAIVRDGRRVGAGALVGTGAVVVADVPAGATVAGVPARPLARAGARA